MDGPGRLAEHLHHPTDRGRTPPDAFTGAAGGAACGDLVRVSVALGDGVHITDAGHDAHGCGAARAAGSAVTTLIRGRTLLQAARVDAAAISTELGGLSAAGHHAAELAADALHRALGAAARARAALTPVPARSLVAMSGGVDSAVAALLTARDGSEPVAVTLELWSSPENDGERSCCSAQAVRGARALAHRLGLPHLTLDLRAEFRAGVVKPWLAGHARGQTLNPCVRCNGSVRLDGMLALADRLGAGTLVTGHYARTDGRPRPLLRAAADPAKDQSYMLASLDPTSLARLRFPLGDLAKPRVRELAAQAGLPVATRPDSQDLCFLAGTGRSEFLARHGRIAARPGPILDGENRTIGRHRGHQGFTVGQRRGLGIGGGRALYVLGTDARANSVTVGPRAALATREVSLEALTLHRAGSAVDGVKLRYRAPVLPATVLGNLRRGHHDRASVRLHEPADGAAPGQLACLLAGDRIVGHATITSPPGARSAPLGS